MWWWTARRGQMVEDLALWSSVHTDSALQSETLMVAVCWDWQQVFQMLSLIVWLEFSDMVLWLDLYRDMILLLISLIWCEYIWAVTALFLNLWWWIRRLHNHLYEYVFYVSVWVCMYVHKSVRACVCVCMCVYVHAHATHLISCGSLFVRTLVNSKEILPDLPLHPFCVMSLLAMWCSLSDWQAVIKKSNTWPHLRWTDETKVSPYQKQY